MAADPRLESLRPLLNVSPIAMLATELESGHILAMNEQAEFLFQVSQSDAIGRTGVDLGFWDSQGDRSVYLQQLQSGSGETFQERSISHDDGTVRHCVLSSRILQDGITPTLIVSTLQDMTDSKLQEEARDKNKAMYRLLAENSLDMVTRHDLEGKYLWVSPSSKSLLGIDPEEMIGTSSLEMIHPDDRAKVMATLGRILEAPVTEKVVYRHKTKSDWIWVESVSRALRDPVTGDLQEIHVSTRDISDRMAAEDRYRNLFENLTTGFALHEIVQDDSGKVVDYRFLEVNPAFEKLTGLASERILGKTVLEALPGVESYWIETFGKVAHTGEPIRFENFSVPLGRWFETWAYRPAPGQFAVLVSDVTERKEREERLRLVLDATSDGIFDWNIRTGHVYYSPAVFAMLGYEDAGFTGSYESWRSLLHPDDLPRTDSLLQDHLRNSSVPYRIEFRMRTRGGGWKWILARGKVVERDPDGTPLRMVGTHSDIHERVEAETQRRLSESRLREVADMSLDMISRHSLDGICLWASPACRQILGIEPESVVGRLAFDFIVEDDLPSVHKSLEMLFLQGKSRLQYRMRRQDRSIYWAESLWSLTRDESGAPHEIHCTTRDISEPKRQSQLLEETQRLAHLGGWEINLETGARAWTREQQVIHGFPPDSLPPDDQLIYSLLDPASQELLSRARERMHADGTSWDIVLRGRKFGGSPMVIRSTCSAERDADGRIRILRGATQDITEQETMRERFDAASRLNQSILSTTDALVVLLDLEGRVVRFNEACQRLSHWSENEIVGLPFLETLVPEEERGATIELFRKITSGVGSFPHENHWISKDGKRHWISWANSVIRDEAGQILYVLGTGIDNTMKRKTESVMEALVQGTSSLFGQAFFEALVSEIAMLLGVRIVTIGRLDSVTRSIRPIASYGDKSSLIPPDFILPLELVESFLERRTIVVPSGMRKGQHIAPFMDALEVESYMGIGLFSASGELVGLLSVFHDQPLQPDELAEPILAIFAERARAEIERLEADQALHNLNVDLERRVQERTTELLAINRELESFSYSVSHDLRSPLRSINGFAQALDEDYAALLNEEGRGYLDRIRNASKRMADLIDDLLSLSHSSRRILHKSDVDLSYIANEILDGLQATEPERNIRFAVEPGLRAHGDPVLLRAVLENLLGNSWKYTRRQDDPLIRFRAEAGTESRACFAVEDNGAGFEMSFADKLFGTFQRLHHTEEFEGNGIGLATVKRILERHGGSIQGRGEVGKGATFTFELPYP